jgi:hypothetical protein
MNTLLNTYVIVRGPSIPENVLLGVFGILFLIFVVLKVYLNYKDEIKTFPQFLWLLTKIITTILAVYFIGTYLANGTFWVF